MINVVKSSFDISPYHMIKILSIAWGLSGGGVSHYIGSINNLNRLDSLDLSHVLIRVPKWPVHQGLWNDIRPTQILIRNRGDFTWLPKLLKITQERDISLLMVHGFNGFIVAGLCRLFRLRIPILATYHGPYHPPSPSRQLVRGVINRYSKWFLLHIATRVITVSEKDRQELIWQGVGGRKIVVVYNGIPDESPIPGDCRKLYRNKGVHPHKILIGTTSGLHPIKGLEYLVRAISEVVKKHPEVRVVLFGSGPCKTQIERLSNSLGVSEYVKFMGFRDDIDRWVAGLDIFVLPSLSEAHSVGLLEAMLAARPIICTAVGGNIESIRPNVDGLVVPARDANALAMALLKLIGDADLRNTLGQSARERFKSLFTESRMLDETFKVIQDTVSKR